MKKRIIICGGLSFHDNDLFGTYVDDIIQQFPNCEIISGHARGADTLGEEYAKQHNIPLKVFPAEWNKYGKAAGPIRNGQMLKYAIAEDAMVIAFWDGHSRGTKNMLDQARRAGVECKIVYYSYQC